MGLAAPNARQWAELQGSLVAGSGQLQQVGWEGCMLGHAAGIAASQDHSPSVGSFGLLCIAEGAWRGRRDQGPHSVGVGQRHGQWPGLMGPQGGSWDYRSPGELIQGCGGLPLLRTPWGRQEGLVLPPSPPPACTGWRQDAAVDWALDPPVFVPETMRCYVPAAARLCPVSCLPAVAGTWCCAVLRAKAVGCRVQTAFAPCTDAPQDLARV